jgi:DNA polymerase III epsilon subunit-like protein
LSQTNPSHFLVCDFETTNKEALLGEILTGHFIYLDQNLNPIDQYEFRAKPRIWDQGADEASKIHGISSFDTITFPEFNQAYSNLWSWLSSLENSYFVAHANRKIFGKFTTYDYAILNLMLFDFGKSFEFGLKFRRENIISTHSLAKFLSLPCGYDLKSIATYYGLSFLHHNAKDDCIVTNEIFKKMVTRVEIDKFLMSENQTKQRSEDDTSTSTTQRRTKKIQRNSSRGVWTT